MTTDAAAIRERLTRAVAEAGLDPELLSAAIAREAARAAMAARPYEDALERVADAARARDESYQAWRSAIAAATQQGAPLRVVAERAGVSKSRVAQIVSDQRAA